MKTIDPALHRYIDKTLGEIADERGCHPVDAMLDIAVQDGLKTSFYFEPQVSRELLDELVNYPYAIYGVSDGRLCMSALTEHTLDRVAEGIRAVVA